MRVILFCICIGLFVFQENDAQAAEEIDIKFIFIEEARLGRMEPELLAAKDYYESGFNPNAISKSGCKGVAQLSDEVCQEQGVTNPFDAWQSIRGGRRHYGWLLRYYHDRYLALAAYHAGTIPVDAAIRKAGSRSWWKVRKYITVKDTNDVYTQDYPHNVLAIYKTFKKGGIPSRRVKVQQSHYAYNIPSGCQEMLVSLEIGYEKIIEIWGEKKVDWANTKTLRVIAEKIKITKKPYKAGKFKVGIIRH